VRYRFSLLSLATFRSTRSYSISIDPHFSLLPTELAVDLSIPI